MESISTGRAARGMLGAAAAGALAAELLIAPFATGTTSAQQRTVDCAKLPAGAQYWDRVAAQDQANGDSSGATTAQRYAEADRAQYR